jgi:hypothetical protein
MTLTLAAHAGAAGSLLAVQDTPYGMRVLIGDARCRAVVLRAFRAAAGQAPTLDDLVRRLGYALRHATGDFTALLAAQFSPDGSVAQLLNLGHPPPLFLHCGVAEALRPARRLPPLGLGDPAGHAYATETVRLPAGATLLFLTDGVGEAGARLAGRRLGDPEEMLLALRNGLAPDVALLALRRDDPEQDEQVLRPPARRWRVPGLPGPRPRPGPGPGQAKRRRRSELPTTKTEEKAIAAPAIIGLSRPAAASGRAATL